jgi:DNA-binding MarR family transcriptional regulator
MTTIAKALQRMEMIKREERDIDPLMPAQTMHVFITIAMNPGISMQKLSEKTNLAQSSCSRNVAALSKWHRLGKAGYDLVEAIEDPEDRRQKVMFLNTRGK